MLIRLLFLFAVVLPLLACESSRGTERGVRQAPLSQGDIVLRLNELPAAPFAAPEPIVRASWGEEEGAYQREMQGSDLGPMALAVDPEGGVAVLDTVGGRIYRYDDGGGQREMIGTAVETADDLVVLENGSLAMLVYRRTPTPHHDVLVRARDGEWLQPRTVPGDVTLPTGLLADGPRLYVEQRHGWLFSTDGSPRLWGRPAGAHLLRARRETDGSIIFEARDRLGNAAWTRQLLCPWPVTEILAVDSSSPYLALVVRHIEDESEATGSAPAHETWLVAFAHDGDAIGRVRLVDERVTDAARPFSLSPEGDIYELQTEGAGVTVLRHRFGGAR